MAAGLSVAGGMAWLAKQAAIAATVGDDGAPPEHLVIAVLYVAGLGLMLGGATGVGAWLLRGRAGVLRVPVALALAPMIFFGIQAAADTLVDSLASDDAHWWWADEGGVVLTAAVFLLSGAMALRCLRPAAGVAYREQVSAGRSD